MLKLLNYELKHHTRLYRCYKTNINNTPLIYSGHVAIWKVKGSLNDLLPLLLEVEDLGRPKPLPAFSEG